MSLKGEAFLCIWNDVEGSQASEYERWHTLEHVPERVASPGFLSGRRYRAAENPEGPYLTIYDLQTLDALETEAYRDLQNYPTSWSAKMRPSFRNFLRIPFKKVASEGIGCAGAIATLGVSLRKNSHATATKIETLLRGQHDQQMSSAYHLGWAGSIPDYSVFGHAETFDPKLHHIVALQETTTLESAEKALSHLLMEISALDPAAFVFRKGCSRLLFNAQHEEVVARWQPRGHSPTAASL